MPAGSCSSTSPDSPTAPRRAPVDPATRFALASLTKPLVAAAALVAAEEGSVDLDAPVAEHVPQVPAAFTLRMLLAHYAGLPEGATAEPLDVAGTA